MKAAVIERLGGVPQCRAVAEVVAPEGGEGARVRAAAIKNNVRMLVAGSHYGSRQLQLPAQVGLDAVVQLADGRRVYTGATPPAGAMAEDRKSTRLNSSHVAISYAVFCLKKKK